MEQPLAIVEDQELVSHEQAEGKLRQMMQARQQRLKSRRPVSSPIPVAPVEEDW
jgi:hypothetical protein